MKDLENTLSETFDFYATQETLIIAKLALLPKGSIKAKVISGE